MKKALNPQNGTHLFFWFSGACPGAALDAGGGPPGLAPAPCRSGGCQRGSGKLGGVLCKDGGVLSARSGGEGGGGRLRVRHIALGDERRLSSELSARFWPAACGFRVDSEAAWWLEDSCGLFGWSSNAAAKRSRLFCPRLS